MINYLRYRFSLIRSYVQYLLDDRENSQRVLAHEWRQALITLVYYDGLLKG